MNNLKTQVREWDTGYARNYIFCFMKKLPNEKIAMNRYFVVSDFKT